MAEKKTTKKKTTKKAVKKTTKKAVKKTTKKTAKKAVKKVTKKKAVKKVAAKKSRVKGTISRSLTKKEGTLKEVEFSFFAPLSQSVHVAGSFNDWDASKCQLKKNKEGHWLGKVKLAEGRYEYKFLIDGQWWENDQKPGERVDNGHGSCNSVIHV